MEPAPGLRAKAILHVRGIASLISIKSNRPEDANPRDHGLLIEVKVVTATEVQFTKPDRQPCDPTGFQMRLVSTLLLCVPLVLAQAMTSETAVGQATPTERGRAIAEKHCARCHAVGLTGTSPMSLAPSFRDLSQRYPIESLAEALAEGIVTGHPAMPHFTFHPREIDALLTYIGSLTPTREPRLPQR